ncbi:hypothetical protein AAC387_Pa11g1961 [Persea americana]
MRLSPRGDSPEVLRVSDSSPSSAESSFRELDDVFLQTQTRIWLGEVLHARFDEEMTIAELLADGELLFQVSKVVWKMLRTKCIETKFAEVYVNGPTAPGKSGGRYMPYSNVDFFLKICKIVGLTGVDLFSPSDVVERRDTRRVCMCIRALSKKARSKHLNIPDFDVVTYTIAMPTDMVGYIRRSLEKSQSQHSSSTFVICSRCMHSKGKYKQKIQEADCIRKLYLSSEESDDAESSFQALEFQSPASDASYDATSLSGLFIDSSRGQDSVVKGNFSTPENRLRLDVQNQRDDGIRTNKYGEVCFVDSGESLSLCSMTCSNCRFPTKNTIVSPLSCLECQIDPNATASCTHWRWIPENSREMYDVDLHNCKTASFVRDSPNKLDGLFPPDSEESFSGELCCNKSMHWHENPRSCLSKVMPSDSYLSFDDMQEEFTNASAVLSDAKLIVSHVANGGYIAEPKIEDYEGSSPNPISCNRATLASKDPFDAKEDFTGGNAHFLKFQNLGKTEQSNSTLEVSAVDEAKMDKLSPRCRDMGTEIASKRVYWNQLDGILSGELDSPCNGFTHNDIYKSSMVMNGNNGDGVSARCMPPHDIYATEICAMVNSIDPGKLFDANATDKIDANSIDKIDPLAAVSEPDAIVTKHLNDASRSIGCFTTTKIAHEAEIVALEKVSSKICLDIAPRDLWQDDVSHVDETQYRKGVSKDTFEEEVRNLSVEQEDSCHTFKICELMQGAVKPFCSEVSAENKVNALSESRQIETLLETNVSKKCCTDNEGDRYVSSASVGESDVSLAKPLGSTFRVNYRESVSESKGATINHSCKSLSNDLLQRKWINRNLLLANFPDYEEKQPADVSTSENKPVPAIDDNTISTLSESSSQTERYRLEIEGMAFPFDFDEPLLDNPKMSNIGLETPNKVALDHGCSSELVFAENLVCNSRFSCINSVEFDCPSAQILSSEPCLIPAGLESKRNISHHSGMNNDDCKNLINEREHRVLGCSMNLKDADSTGNKDEETENYVLDARMSHGSEGKDTEKGTGVEHKHDKKLLLKSLAGGMTFFGAAFFLFYLRSRGKEKIGSRGIRGRTVLSQNQKPRQDGLQRGKAVGVFPGERLKLQD